MLNLLIGFLCTVMGVVLIIQYGNERVTTRQKKYFDPLVTLACMDLLCAGMFLAKFLFS